MLFTQNYKRSFYFTGITYRVKRVGALNLESEY